MLKLYNAELRNKLKKEGKDVENLPLPVIDDVEYSFNTIIIDGDEVSGRIIEEIEQGTYLDAAYFTDRFGAKVSNMYLSTGCKAALLVHYRQDAIIDTKECGLNARDAIIKFCPDGNVLFYEHNIGICTYGYTPTEVNIEYEGRVYKEVEKFNDYVF